MLTGRQLDLLSFLDQYTRQHGGRSPSFEEMRQALNLHSKAGIHRLIRSLEEREYVRRLPRRARAVEVLRRPVPAGELPPAADTQAQAPAPAFASPARGSRPARPEADAASQPPDQKGTTALPLYGRIAAGTPIEAIRQVVDTIEVPPDMIRTDSAHYVLQVQGDSMIQAGILDGDLVVIRACTDARSGQIVVALVDQCEATLKILRKFRGSVALEPANPDHATRICPAGTVEVQGVLAGLIRNIDSR